MLDGGGVVSEVVSDDFPMSILPAKTNSKLNNLGMFLDLRIIIFAWFVYRVTEKTIDNRCLEGM